jgi:hypothetical protein
MPVFRVDCFTPMEIQPGDRIHTREERLSSVLMREAHTRVTVDHRRPYPGCFGVCDKCGEWTYSWCEACEAYPDEVGVTDDGMEDVMVTAMCRACDAEHWVCSKCELCGRTYDEAHALIMYRGIGVGYDEAGNLIDGAYHIYRAGHEAPSQEHMDLGDPEAPEAGPAPVVTDGQTWPTALRRSPPDLTTTPEHLDYVFNAYRTRR